MDNWNWRPIALNTTLIKVVEYIILNTWIFLLPLMSCLNWIIFFLVLESTWLVHQQTFLIAGVKIPAVLGLQCPLCVPDKRGSDPVQSSCHLHLLDNDLQETKLPHDMWTPGTPLQSWTIVYTVSTINSPNSPLCPRHQCQNCSWRTTLCHWDGSY